MMLKWLKNAMDIVMYIAVLTMLFQRQCGCGGMDRTKQTAPRRQGSAKLEMIMRFDEQPTELNRRNMTNEVSPTRSIMELDAQMMRFAMGLEPMWQEEKRESVQLDIARVQRGRRNEMPKRRKARSAGVAMLPEIKKLS